VTSAPNRPTTSAPSTPFRNVDRATPEQLRKRGWWLLVFTIVFPGLAQLVGGSRRLGSFAIRVTFFVYSFIAALALLGLINKSWAVWFVTLPFVGTFISWVLIAFSVFFFFLAADALRLSRVASMYNRDRWIALSAFVLVAVLGISSISWAGRLVGTGTGAIGSIFNQSGFTAPVDGRYNVMLLGSDAAHDRFGVRPDSISVVSIDASTGTAVTIQIPRNLQKVPFRAGSPLWSVYPNGWSCGVNCLINAIYKDTMDNHRSLYPEAVKHGSTPGVEATRDAVEGVTGLTIQSYVLIDMAGFSRLIDALGGIDIVIKQNLPVGGQKDDGSDAKYWLHASPNPQHLDGKNALWYGRSRHATSDYDRMARQHEIENAILKQMNPATVLSHFEEIASVSKSLIMTDVPSGMLSTYLDLAQKARKQGIKTLALVPKNGFEPDVPNYDKIHAAVTQFIAKG
jgi:LCP family protein required for cell wall assembly